MKHKIIILLSFTLLVAATAFAGAGKEPSWTEDGNTTTKPFTFKPSTNITIAYSVDATTSAQKYAAVTKNKAGNRFFGSSNDSSNIYFVEADANIGKDATDNIATTAVGTAGVLTSTDWKSQ